MAFVPSTSLVSRPSPSPISVVRLGQPVSTRSVPPARRAMTMSAHGSKQRIVSSPLPQLFVYDHCPFCVRVRHMLGFKNVKYNLVWLLNDDVDTPTALIGKKMVPIFQPSGANGPAVGESLDICNLIDSDERFGAVGSVRAASGRTDIPQVLDSLADPMRRLTRPRFASAPLPEFTFEDGRNAYIQNHPLKNPASYDENVQRSDEYIAAIESQLKELSEMIHSPHAISDGGFSYDDIIFFPRLRSLTIVRNLQLPTRIAEYIQYQAKCADILLYDHMAS